MRYTKKIDKALRSKARRYLEDDYREGVSYFGLMKLFVIDKNPKNKCGFSVKVSGETSCTRGLRKNYGLINKNTKFIVSFINFHHLKNYSGSTLEHLDDDNYRQSKKLYTWLFNHSPYKHCFVTKSADKAFKQGYIVLDANQDGRMVAEAAMTTRSIWEQSRDHIKYAFDKLTNEGVSPAMAWQAAYHFMYFDKKNINPNGAWGHTAPQSNMDSLLPLKQFVIEGKMLPVKLSRVKGVVTMSAKGTKLPDIGGIPSGIIAEGWGEFDRKGVVQARLKEYLAEQCHSVKVHTELLGTAVLNALESAEVVTSSVSNTPKNWSIIAKFFKDLERELERL